jgi:hypothetical protein
MLFVIFNDLMLYFDKLVIHYKTKRVFFFCSKKIMLDKYILRINKFYKEVAMAHEKNKKLKQNNSIKTKFIAKKL